MSRSSGLPLSAIDSQSVDPDSIPLTPTYTIFRVKEPKITPSAVILVASVKPKKSFTDIMFMYTLLRDQP